MKRKKNSELFQNIDFLIKCLEIKEICILKQFPFIFRSIFITEYFFSHVPYYEWDELSIDDGGLFKVWSEKRDVGKQNW